MSIRTRIVGWSLFVLLLFSGVSFYNYRHSLDSNTRLILVNEFFLPFSRQMIQLQSDIHSLVEDMRRFYFDSALTAGSSNFSRVVRDLYPYMVIKKIVAADRMLEKYSNQNPVNKMVTTLRQILGQARVEFEKMMSFSEKNRFEAQYQKLREQLHELSKKVDGQVEEITNAVQREARDNLISGLALSLMVVFFGLISLLLSHKALSPLPQLVEKIRKIGEGNFQDSIKVKLSDKDETALLAREFNRMLEALEERDSKISEQQKELLQREKLAAVGQLSAEVVHEIRNPLNSICLNIDWLESELKSKDPEVANTLASLSKEITRLNQITESYLVRARVRGDEEPKTAVNHLIQEVVNFSKEEDRRKNIEIKLSLASEEIYIRTDRSRLQQAFLNVLRNAREAMPRGGHLCVTTQIKNNVFEIEFRDTGHGMNELTRRQAFSPFFTTKPNGTGLGLILTKEIVEEALGSLHCESILGEGTSVRFQFPV